MKDMIEVAIVFNNMCLLIWNNAHIITRTEVVNSQEIG